MKDKTVAIQLIILQQVSFVGVTDSFVAKINCIWQRKMESLHDMLLYCHKSIGGCNVANYIAMKNLCWRSTFFHCKK